eukprot:TRINITY_DN6567_c0_g1_i1.p1 TRINITY_DN6567_c0_g1~~TRINITY_DN6567_c0_g1_i1.p1  ORF type:complete len:135 (-),score=27.57 TRINITY_DN6567_c0_g1_i1:153-557(-)
MAKREEPVLTQQIANKFQEMRQTYSAISQKIGEMEIQKREHDLVITAISKLETSRKCYRMINGILVERTVGEVLPAVKKNKENIEKTIQTLTSQLNQQETALNEFASKYKLLRTDKDNDKEEKNNDPGSKGVLV